jgi:hypothetical protein
VLCFQITAFSQSKKIDEFGKVSEKEWKSRFDKVLLNERDNYCENQIVIIIYAPTKTVQSLGKKYLAYTFRRECHNKSSGTVIYKGKSLKKQKTEIWIVPPGAEPPSIKN